MELPPIHLRKTKELMHMLATLASKIGFARGDHNGSCTAPAQLCESKPFQEALLIRQEVFHDLLRRASWRQHLQVALKDLESLLHSPAACTAQAMLAVWAAIWAWLATPDHVREEALEAENVPAHHSGMVLGLVHGLAEHLFRHWLRAQERARQQIQMLSALSCVDRLNRSVGDATHESRTRDIRCLHLCSARIQSMALSLTMIDLGLIAWSCQRLLPFPMDLRLLHLHTIARYFPAPLEMIRLGATCRELRKICNFLTRGHWKDNAWQTAAAERALIAVEGRFDDQLVWSEDGYLVLAL
jgi:hypothetical protein